MLRRPITCAAVVFLTACPPRTESPDAGSVVNRGPCDFTEQEPAEPRRHTPRWAFEPWISKDISDGADTYAFVEGFEQRDIPVGVVVLDSPWETNYNTFIPNEARYPNFGQMVSDLRARDIRTVLWVTQMVNEESFDVEPGGDRYEGEASNFVEGSRCDFYVNGGETYLWWKGKGAGVDFFNPAARAWWHEQQNMLLDLGVAGWKLDFGDSYIPTEQVTTAAGTKAHQEYSEAYYRDFLAYGVSRRGAEEFVTMVRPYDESYNFAGRFYARKEHAPVGWVGDNRRDWIGLTDALDHMFRSARAGYVVVGSDIGGYLDVDDRNVTGPRIPFSQEVFARWTAVGALTPFMQLHGRANITPWTVPDRPDETVSLYRYWSKLHQQLIPFFFSLSEEAYAGGDVIMRPIGDENAWAGDYRYMLGDAFLVAPILQDGGIRDVALPSGAQWFDWFSGMEHNGGTTLSAYDASDRTQLPVFVRSGAIVPMNVCDDSTGIGDAHHSGLDTVLVYPSDGAQFRRHDEDGAVTTITATATTVSLSRIPRRTLLRIRSDGAGISVNGTALTEVDDKASLIGRGDAVLREGPYSWVFAEVSSETKTFTLSPL